MSAEVAEMARYELAGMLRDCAAAVEHDGSVQGHFAISHHAYGSAEVIAGLKQLADELLSPSLPAHAPHTPNQVDR